MPRRVQDIVPGDRRSIRNIPLSEKISSESLELEKTRRKSHSKEPETSVATKEAGKEIPIRRIPVTPPHHKTKKNSGGGKWLFISVAIIGLIVTAGWAASSYFSRATFTIVPKTYPLTVNGTYIAQAAVGSPLPYELVTLTDSASTTVMATKGPSVSTKAEGTVTLFNTNSDSQRLVAGSRLSSDGTHIYRLTSSVTIPAKSSSGPGTIVTSIVADQPGEEFNISRGSTDDMKFLGLKGTARYDTMYARPASDIEGGFVGSKKIIDPKALASTSASLATEIKQKLLSQAAASLPEGYISYENVHVASFSAPIVSGNDPTRAIITVKGTVTGIFFRKNHLAERLAGKEVVAQFGSFPYDTPGLENLDVSIANAKDFSTQKKNSLILRIKGDAHLVGSVPIEEIRAKVAGIPLAETQEVLKPYGPIVETVSGELIPPWAKVPTDLERIIINIEEK